MTPLEAVGPTAPVLTPVLVIAAGFAVAFLVGCAEGHCKLNFDGTNYDGDLDGMSVGELLDARAA